MFWNMLVVSITIHTFDIPNNVYIRKKKKEEESLAPNDNWYKMKDGQKVFRKLLLDLSI